MPDLAKSLARTTPRAKSTSLCTRLSPEAFSLALLAALILLCPRLAQPAGIAYGTVNNFDTVNDTSNICHGFEIELDDILSSDITYTFDYNHYGTPQITEDTWTVPGHTNVHVYYQAVYTNNSGWSAYTAIPAGPIPPTAGHQFTNPGTNFGGEHFGVGFRVQPTKVLYFWLLDTGNHVLSRGGQVSVSTPTFTYSPPVGAAPAQIAAVIPAPVPIRPPSFEFSDASWVKVITTTAHTNTEVRVTDLMTPDPEDPTGRDWRNGQTNIEVETEWQLLQIDYNSSDYNPTNGIGGPNGKLAGPAHNLGHSDDVVTYRYEFYTYVGPYDDLSEPPTHEALCQMPGPDGIHGSASYSNTVVVGKFLGAQMTAMAGNPPLALIDHLPDGEVGVEFSPRTLVIASDTNFTATADNLPDGLLFDVSKALVYGIPTAQAAGVHIVTVTATATASNSPVLVKNYPILISTVPDPAPHSAVDTTSSPPAGGTTAGDGVYTNGTTATLLATPNAGYRFVNWRENGAVVSTAAAYTFTNIVNRSLVAAFAPAPTISLTRQPAALLLSWSTNFPGYTLQQNTNLTAAIWSTAAEKVITSGTNYEATALTTNTARFFRLSHP
jgi:hypothetical protein